ncbi:FIST C-terminal domain-containing protein [Natronosporangium hydrolyticum]|uniref:FIST C-terminal domain-containing protein n=1 Tax=Natronosporangium hydrolyticum TaxID=2811111 RepID=A0A895YCW2_9ACTN|nr:FIST N-terminal domain-containing protein [Natronosporangium hydrolyticum]QSB14022.1 FIST C-terminal domain-containing protein [Natronosporangium hydrolyticum]
MSGTSTHRWFGIGHSEQADPDAAGEAAASAALAGRSPSLLIVFSSISYDLPTLLASVRRAAGPGVPIVGCSAMGEISAHGVTDGSVVVAALGGAGLQVYPQVRRGVSGRRHAAGREAADPLASLDAPYRVLLLLCDGLSFELHRVVRGAYAAAGAAVPLVGGCAADNLTFTATYQFYGDGDEVEIMSDAVVGVAIGSDAPLGVGVAHGWRRTDEAMVVTSSEESRVFQLDNEPALDVYLRLIGEDVSIVDDPDKFHNRAYYHPLGLSRRDGDDMRVVHAADVSDRSLICLANVPQGALASLMETDPESLVSSAGESCRQASRMLGGAPPIGFLTFDCGIRKVMLGHDSVQREVAQMRQFTGDAPVGGFYTYGEIARSQGSRGTHHLAVASLALA